MLRDGISRVLVMLALWWVLAEGAAGSWLFGLLVAFLVALASLLIFSPGSARLQWWRLPGFLVWFIWQSLLAGLDVSVRLLRRRVLVQPAVLTLDLALPEGAPRWWLANTLSLLPGSISVDFRESVIEVHSLDASRDVGADVLRAQQRVARLFGLQLELPA